MKDIQRHAKTMQEKAAQCTVTETGIEGTYIINSPSGNSYVVHLTDDGATCTCDWHVKSHRENTICSHIMRAQNYVEEQQGRRLSFWTTEQDAERQHRPTAVTLDVWTSSRRIAGAAAAA